MLFRNRAAVFEIFNTCATVDIFTEDAGVCIEIAEYFIGVVLCAYVVVVLGKKNVGLHTSVHRHFIGNAVTGVLCGGGRDAIRTTGNKSRLALFMM